MHFHVVGVLVVDPSESPDFGVDSSRPSSPSACTCCHRSGAGSSRCRTSSAGRVGSRIPTSTSTATSATSRCPRQARCTSSPSPGEIASTPLDRGHPLWEIGVVAGSRAARSASSRRCTTRRSTVCGRGPDGPPLRPRPGDAETPPPETPRQGESGPSDLQPTLGALGDLAQRPAEIVKIVRSVGSAAARHRRRAAAGRDPDGPSPTLPFTAPPAPWNGALTPHRSTALADARSRT